LLKRFARSVVKGQGYSESKFTFAAEAYISRLASFNIRRYRLVALSQNGRPQNVTQMRRRGEPAWLISTEGRLM